MGRSHRALFILIGLLVASIGCRTRGSSNSATDAMGSAGNGHPELFMNKLKIQSYGPKGLEWEMMAPRADGYTTKNKMHAEDITITFFRNGKKATDITANDGVIRFDSKVETHSPESNPPTFNTEKLDPGDMFLSGDVVAVSTDGSRLTTDWLLFDKSRDLIFSTAPVKIVRRDSVTKGVGLEANSNLSSVKIFKQTLTIKEPDNKNETR